MKCTFLDSILIDKINAIKQMGVIVDAHYTGEEYDNTLKLLFTDDAGQTVAISFDDPDAYPDRFRVDAILFMLMCCRIFSENGLSFPFWNTAFNDWRYVRPMLRSVRKLLLLKSAGRIADFVPRPEAENAEWLDLTFGVSEDWFGCGNDLEQLAYCVTHG